jgi:hypothetical protein
MACWTRVWRFQVVELGTQPLADDGAPGVEGGKVSPPEKAVYRGFDDQAQVSQCDAQVEGSKPAR